MIENRGTFGPTGDGSPDPFDPERDLAEVVAGLEELGANDRRALPAQFIDRAMIRTQSLLAAGEGARRGEARAEIETAPIRRLTVLGGGWGRGAMRLAAVMALMVGVGAAWLSMRGTGTGASSPPLTTGPSDSSAGLARVALDIDLLDGGPWSRDLDREIAVLLAESAMLGGEIEGDATDLLDEGAL